MQITPKAQGHQVANLSVSFYDRATNEPIEPLTNPKWCIEPLAQLTMFVGKQKFAALTKLPTKRVTHQYRKTLPQRLLSKPATTFTRNEFDFDRAVDYLTALSDLQPSDSEANSK